MRKKKAFWLIAFAYIITILGFTPDVQAEETGGIPQDVGGFSFELLFPENQHNKEVGYFDLRVTPGQTQTVQVKMNNTSDKEIIVDVKLNSAKTNSNGVIEYGPNALEKDASLTFDFIEIVTGPEEVVIPPNSEQMVDLEVRVPETSFSGYISGGVQLQQKDDAAQEQKTGMVVNKFAYIIGFQLSESDEMPEEELALNKVYPELQNYRNAVFINFSNIQPIYVNGMTVEAQIMRKGSNEVLYDTKKTKIRMAPNTMIDFPVSMNGEKMVAGDYQAKIVVTTEAGGRWEWDQEFTISDEEADKFNNEDLTLVQSGGINWLLIGIIVGGLLIVIVVIFLIVRFFRKKNTKKKSSKSKGRKSPKKGKK
ncbi:DUF916 and DUF3324 domain-containing protein [uncultured Enterococcus sp.]|uniref:DUF916 and DUF3324 domain-containing protein n=1 Tax=uncultured Enterococcus sp. TaxID=167972 RepID=UPI002AA62FF3|nr:DUF916 and DUF3324 domain-containing protein [uncultured Enterococcus sp.]